MLDSKWGKRASVLTLAWAMAATAVPAGQASAADGAFDAVYEAENASGSGIIVDNKHPGFTGTGFIDFNPNAPGGYAEWVISVPAGGTYTLTFRYASGAAEDRPAEIRVDGTVVAQGLSFPSTGDFTVWRTAATEAVLNAGTHTVRATATGSGGGANIDHLRVSAGAVGETPVETEQVDLSAMIGGLLQKKLRTLGLLAAERQANAPIARIEFMSLLNDALGYRYEEKYPGLGLDPAIWEQPRDRWDAYVLQAAQEAGYADAGQDGRIDPDQPLTRKEAADMISRALDLRPDDKNGSVGVGAVTREGYMSAKGGNGFGSKDMLSIEEAKMIAARISSERGGSDGVRITGVHAIGDNLLALPLSGTLATVDFDDIALGVASSAWKSLSPVFADLRPVQASTGTDRYGHTVLFFRLAEKLGPGITIPQQPSVVQVDAAALTEQANRLVSWQMDRGGWTKAMPYDRMWNGSEPKSSQLGADGKTELGAIDNNATTKELRTVAQAYRETGNAAFRDSALKGVGFLLNMQYETGGWPQVYPERGIPGDSVYYSNYVTFNDNAMINVLDLIGEMLQRRYPFDSDLMDDNLAAKLKQARDRGIDYILRSQIVVDGALTAWCAQHDPDTYAPMKARAYEHPSISGSESVGIVRYLMSLPNPSEEVRRAIASALQWFEDAKLEGIRYVSRDPNGVYFVPDPASDTWYRFYEIGTNRGIFSGRDGVIKYSIQEIEQERRDGYSWAGSYASKLLAVAQATGYYGDQRLYARIVGSNSKDAAGRSWASDRPQAANDLREELSALPNRLTVSKDGQGDYATVQAAVDAVQSNNTERVEIMIKNGVYKEVVTVPADKPFITMIGESAEGTVISYDNYAGRERPTGGTYGTSGSASMFVSGSDFTAKNLTIENSFDESSVTVSGKQAVALNVRGERQRFENVRFLGNQDTLLTNGGTQYFDRCYIEGDVDFIFGSSRAVFDNCTIHSLDRGSATNNGYITAASTNISEPYGYLIINSKLTSDAADGTVWLGRPWHPGGNPDAIASVLYMNCEMGAHINPIGWTDMSGFLAKDARFAEYGNYGPGAIASDTRPQLTSEQAQAWTIENVLKGWNPKA